MNLSHLPSAILQFDGKLALPLRFRRARRDDGSLLFAQCFADRSPAQFQDSFQRSMKAQGTGQRLILIAESGDNLVGSGQLIRHADRIEIADLAVASSYQNQRIGTALLTVLARVAAHAGFREVEIGVMAGNHEALKLYRRLGFVCVSRFSFPNDAEALVLRKQVGAWRGARGGRET